MGATLVETPLQAGQARLVAARLRPSLAGLEAVRFKRRQMKKLRACHGRDARRDAATGGSGAIGSGASATVASWP